MEAKKISFGFNKVAKKPNLLANNKQASKEESKVELIKCLEGQEIKLVEEKKEEAPLVIPLKENQKTSAALASLIKRRAVLLGESDEPPPPPVTQEKQPGAENSNGTIVTANESLEQRAARELLAATQANGETEQSNIVLPLVKADELPLDGAKEATLNDYEEIPIQQFGLAMLRGMGWIEPPKKQGEPPVDEMLFVRPKGMGLGADKALKPKPLLVQPEANEVLEIKKQAYVRILGGKFKDQYGQIEGFDDHACRVIVKMAIGGTKEAFNEFLCQPVSKKEYAQYGKCINTAKYEEYKKLENKHGQIILKKEKPDEKPRIKRESRSPQQRRRYDDRESERKQDDHQLRDISDRNSARRDEHASHSSKYRDESQRRYEQDERKQNRTQRYDKYHDDVEERTHSVNVNRYRDSDKQQSKSHKSRSHDRNDYREQSSSYRHSHATSPPTRSKSSDDTSESSGTDSDSDSAYERKHKKSSNKAKSKKKTSKKHKRSKSSRRKHKSSSTEATSESTSSSEDERSRNKHHKKKTKKSKKPRSRTRSSSRTKGRR